MKPLQQYDLQKLLLASLNMINAAGDVMDKYDNKKNQGQALVAAGAAILLALTFEREEPQDKINRIANNAISCIAKLIKEDV